MKLSIIVAVYNMAADGKLQFCLDSLLNQTISDYEILAVDDASEDDSYRILQEYERKYQGRVRVFCSPENRKQGGARNIGLLHAAGTWIGFMDSDDWAAPDMYEKLLQKAEETGADVAGCDYQITYEHSMKPGKTVQNNTADQTGVLTDEKYRKIMLDSGSMMVKIYRKEVIDRFGLRFPEQIFYEDNCAAPVWLFHFRHFEKVEEPLYYYYQNPNSTTHGFSEAKCRDRMAAGRMLAEQCRQEGYDKFCREELEYEFTKLYYINTLFTYVIGVRPNRIAFLKELAEGMREEFPHFRQNSYYLAQTDAEQKKLIDWHLRSPVCFLLYYKALSGYRKVRKKLLR